MPDPTETPPTETPAPETPAPETLEDIGYTNVLDDPLMASLKETFAELIASDDSRKPDAPAAKPETRTETVETPPEEPAAPAVTVTRAKPVTREDLLEVIREARGGTPLPAQPAPPPAPSEPQVELTDEEKDQLAMAEHAAKLIPDKYAEFPVKLKRFYRDQQEYIRQHEHEYGRTFDNEDTEWKRFLDERRPFMPDHDRNKVERDQILAEARAIAAEERKKLTEEFEARTRRLETQPIYERKLKEFEEKSKEALKPTTDDATEARIYEEKRKVAAAVTDTYWKLKMGLEPWDYQKNPVHQFIGQLVEVESENFARNGGKERIRDGKQFVPPYRFGSLTREQQLRAWTYSADDVVDMITKRAQFEAQNEIKEEYARKAKEGWVRAPRAAVRNGEKPEPKAMGAVTPSPSRAPGAATTSAPNGTEVRPAADVFEILGLPQPGSAPL